MNLLIKAVYLLKIRVVVDDSDFVCPDAPVGVVPALGVGVAHAQAGDDVLREDRACLDALADFVVPQPLGVQVPDVRGHVQGCHVIPP